ncbi:hypothetical protein C7Y72_21110 [Paraconexibacter algicola]|uniref:Uncharacterized protein n=1 Tax=Paraconexibacter algicola TaxID=2133960 RepID=A0A2T4UBI4_9ACTN|nr:hypothetical protein C7Y72_21110 [Paraconexibacter algicola]
MRRSWVGVARRVARRAAAARRSSAPVADRAVIAVGAEAGARRSGAGWSRQGRSGRNGGNFPGPFQRGRTPWIGSGPTPSSGPRPGMSPLPMTWSPMPAR